jgi:CarboxypepD_reg-like domain/TonB-dependent Receptor Plug Domain
MSAVMTGLSQLKLIFIVFVLFNFLFVSFLSAQDSLIRGRVTDAVNAEPLIGVNIFITELPGVGTTTDNEGNFTIRTYPGLYSLKVSYVGYSPVVKTDVVLLSGKETFVNIKLTPNSIEMNEVTVKSDYFDKATQVNNLATITLSPEEIRRSPGSMQDFQRILQGMAGVSFSNDQNNELLVRGGSPDENLTVLDEMELQSTNHYPNEFNSGGPINMINVDLIDNIQFSTGGFISKYGDKLSSVMEITTREGTRNSYLDGDVDLSMAGAGGVFEGKINNRYYENIAVDQTFNQRIFDSNGTDKEQKTLNSQNLYSDNHHNSNLALKTEFFLKFDQIQDFNFGGSLITGDFIQNLYAAGDDARYLVNGKWTPTVVVAPADLKYNIALMSNWKYYSYILPFSDDMEISLRWRYASGEPFTPEYWTTDEEHFEGGVRWSHGTWKEVDGVNITRYPDYDRLDLSFNSRFNFEKWSIAIVLSVQNIYNRKNIAGYQYNSDGTYDTIYQFSLLPVLGIDVRF